MLRPVVLQLMAKAQQDAEAGEAELATHLQETTVELNVTHQLLQTAVSERDKQLYEGAVRTRYAILLTKAKAMAEHTLTMATRTGENSEWVERTRQALKAIDEGIAAEEAALAKLPYPRADFDAYFAQMEAAAKPTAPKSRSR